MKKFSVQYYVGKNARKLAYVICDSLTTLPFEYKNLAMARKMTNLKTLAGECKFTTALDKKMKQLDATLTANKKN